MYVWQTESNLVCFLLQGGTEISREEDNQERARDQYQQKQRDQDTADKFGLCRIIDPETVV
jgi:outer membrane biogenesis lipoprotein LolB